MWKKHKIDEVDIKENEEEEIECLSKSLNDDIMKPFETHTDFIYKKMCQMTY